MLPVRPQAEGFEQCSIVDTWKTDIACGVAGAGYGAAERPRLAAGALGARGRGQER
jgi:hypothetical protein